MLGGVATLAIGGKLNGPSEMANKYCTAVLPRMGAITFR